MLFRRSDLQSDLERLRSSRLPEERAFGDNCLFEERVCDARRTAFEADDPTVSSLKELQAKHFFDKVQGKLHSHIPVTFQAVNKDALYEPEIEENQKIVRLERLDSVLADIGAPSFADLNAAVSPGTRDVDLIFEILDQFRLYPGARPAFVAFKSEVAADLAAPGWLLRLRNRMGLGHYAPASGERQVFALMEYLVKDVLTVWRPQEARGAVRPFAFPTVLESQGSPYFFPGPRDLASSFAVDLAGTGSAPIRELLHVRISYRPDHMVKVGELVGPLPIVRLGTARDAHLGRLRAAGAPAGFGATMSGEVDE